MIVFVGVFAVALNFVLRVLAKRRAFRWLEERGTSGLLILNPFPTRYRYFIVYVGALVALVGAVVFFR